MRYEVGLLSELPPGERMIVVAGGRSIGVFNVDGNLYALRNRCPHQGAPLANGAVCIGLSASSPGEYRSVPGRPVVRCPWHGWEFELATGRSWFDPHGTRVRRYEVTVERPDGVDSFPVTCEDGTIYIEMSKP